MGVLLQVGLLLGFGERTEMGFLIWGEGRYVRAEQLHGVDHVHEGVWLLTHLLVRHKVLLLVLGVHFVEGLYFLGTHLCVVRS